MSFFDSEQFDASKIEPSNFDALPPGDYPCLIEKLEEKKTKDGLGLLVSVRLKVVEGKYKNRTVFSNINLKNKSETAQAIGRGQLSALCRAAGVIQPRNWFELCNKVIKVTLKVVPNQNGSGMVNNVAAYLPISGQVSAQATSVSQVASETPVDAPWLK